MLDDRRPDIRHLLLQLPEHGDRAALRRPRQRAARRCDQRADRRAVTSYVQSALQDGTTYYYIVTAMNSVGESAASTEVSATPQAAVAAPAAPTGPHRDGRRRRGRHARLGARSPARRRTTSYWATATGVTRNGTRIAAASPPLRSRRLDRRDGVLLRRHGGRTRSARAGRECGGNRHAGRARRRARRSDRC